jgi:hypothetical protein
MGLSCHLGVASLATHKEMAQCFNPWGVITVCTRFLAVTFAQGAMKSRTRVQTWPPCPSGWSRGMPCPSLSPCSWLWRYGQYKPRVPGTLTSLAYRFQVHGCILSHTHFMFTVLDWSASWLLYALWVGLARTVCIRRIFDQIPAKLYYVQRT